MPVDIDDTFYDSAADLLRMQDGSALNTSVYSVTHNLSATSGTTGGGEISVGYNQREITLTVTNITSTVKQRPLVYARIPWDFSSGSIDNHWKSSTGSKWQLIAGSGLDQNYPSDRFKSEKNAHLYPCMAWETDDGKTIGVSFDQEYACFLQRLLFGDDAYLTIAPHTTSTTDVQNIPDLLNPNESFTIKIWIRVVESTGLNASIEAVRPMIDWYQTGDLAERYQSPWVATRGRALGLQVANQTGVGNPRHYVSLDGAGGKRFDQCTNLAEAWQIVADRFGGVASLKALGYRTIMLTNIGGDDDGYWPPEAISRMPAHLNTDASWFSLLDWQIRNRMRAAIYVGFAFSHQSDSVWNAPRLLGFTGGVSVSGTLGTSGQFACDSLANVLTRSTKPVLAWTAEAQAAFRDNYHKAARFVAELHLDTLPSGNEVPIIKDEIRALREAFPACELTAEPGRRTVTDWECSDPYMLGTVNSPFDGPCPLMAVIQDVATTDLNYMVQIDEGGVGAPADNDEAEARGLAVEAYGSSFLRMGDLSKNNSNVSTPEGSDTYGVGKTAADWESEFNQWAMAALEAAGARAMSSPVLAQDTFTGDISAVVTVLSYTNSTSKGQLVYGVLHGSNLDNDGGSSAPSLTMTFRVKDAGGTTRLTNISTNEGGAVTDTTAVVTSRSTISANQTGLFYLPPGWGCELRTSDGISVNATVEARVVAAMPVEQVYEVLTSSFPLAAGYETVIDYEATTDQLVAFHIYETYNSSNTFDLLIEIRRDGETLQTCTSTFSASSTDKIIEQASMATPNGELRPAFLRAGDSLRVRMRCAAVSTSIDVTGRVYEITSGSNSAGNNMWLQRRWK